VPPRALQRIAAETPQNSLTPASFLDIIGNRHDTDPAAEYPTDTLAFEAALTDLFLGSGEGLDAVRRIAAGNYYLPQVLST
jgi:hypothetical protein